MHRVNRARHGRGAALLRRLTRQPGAHTGFTRRPRPAAGSPERRMSNTVRSIRDCDAGVRLVLMRRPTLSSAGCRFPLGGNGCFALIVAVWLGEHKHLFAKSLQSVCVDNAESEVLVRP